MEDAESMMKAGKKCASKGLFKKPDWDTAATYYDKAAQKFQYLKKRQQAEEAFGLAADAHEKAGNNYFAGLALEKLADSYKENGDMAQATAAMQRASLCHAAEGKPDKQAEVLVKAAKMVLSPWSFGLTAKDAKDGKGSVAYNDAKTFLEEALDILETNERWHVTQDAYKSLIQLHLKAEKYKDACEIIQRSFKAYVAMDQVHNINKGVLEIVVINLFSDDLVAAERALQMANESYGGFPTSEHSRLGECLVRACEQLDDVLLAETITDQTFTFLASEVARMTKKLKVVGGSGAPRVAAPRAPPVMSPSANTSALPTASSPTAASSSSSSSSPPVPPPEEDCYDGEIDLR